MSKSSLIMLTLLSLFLTSNVWAQSGSDSEAQAARNACADKEESDACEFNDANGNTINGTCQYKDLSKSNLYCSAYH